MGPRGVVLKFKGALKCSHADVRGDMLDWRRSLSEILV